MKTGYVYAAFRDAEPVARWFASGMPLPRGIRIRSYSEAGASQQPFRGRVDAVARNLWLNFYGDGFHFIARSPCPREPVWTLDVFECAEGWLLRHASSLLEHLSEHGLWYGYSCQFDEHMHRNWFGYDLWETGRSSGAMLAKDCTRYIPGLYWLNYFSNEHSDHWRLNLAALQQAAGGVLTPTSKGTLLQLRPRPSEWPIWREKIDALIDADARFFSLARVERPPPNIAPAAFADFLGRLADRWP